MARPLRYHPASMEHPPNQTVEGTTGKRFGPGWFLLLAALLFWHGWLTLSLFGPVDCWQHLLSDVPILSGRHPLHLYHGYLGAQSLIQRGTSCCYDPSFQAAYPKTPVFDSGSRPAELFLLLAGGTYQPAAYKIGLALCCFLAPLLLTAAARGAGLSPGAACLATALGVLLWWGKPCREALAAGDVDLLLAALAALAHFGLLLCFDRTPGLVPWLGILATGYLAWFAHPFLSVILLPLALVYYLSVGHRHGLFWHVALFLAVGGALAGNASWLHDWLHYWWIRSPLQPGPDLLPHRTFQTLWAAPLWGDPPDRVLALFLLLAGLIGVILLNRARQRAAARLLGLGAVGFVGLALVGISWEPMSRLGTAHLLTPALLFATVPAAHAVVRTLVGIGRGTGPWGRACPGGRKLSAPFRPGGEPSQTVVPANRYTRAEPLDLGPDPEKEAVLEAIRTHTSPQARILWEDRPGQGRMTYWTALLPLLSADGSGHPRSFLGGLDPAATIEHAYASFNDGVLAGYPISGPRWGDQELQDFCRRYNVGWVVCWSRPALDRFHAWKTGAVPVTELHDGDSGCLFAIHRPHSFALKGQATWLHADWTHVALADVVPEDGQVVLSLHYLEGLRASPSRVVVEREENLDDPIPFVRLRLADPATRVTLTWTKR